MNLEETIEKLEEDIFRGHIITNYIAALHTVQKENLKRDKELLKEKKNQLEKKLKGVQK